MVLCPVFVALRFTARRLNHARWGWDDYFIFPALFTVLISQAADMTLIQAGGVGRHVAYWEQSDSNVIVAWLKIAFAVEFLYLLCICLTKLALLAIYLRILVGKRDRIIAWVLVGITIAAWISQTVACCLQCIPFDYQWDKSIPGGSCFNQQEFYEYLSISNLITDVVMLILPIPTILTLKIGTQQKVALGFVFLTGSCGFVASILRFVTYFKVDLLSDVTYNSGQLVLWTIIEPGMYLISACLPAMRPLLTRVLRLVGVSQGSDVRESHRNTPVVGRSKDIFGDQTPLATADAEALELTTSTHPRMSRFRRTSTTGQPNEPSVVTHISSAGRKPSTDRRKTEGSYFDETPSLNSHDSAENARPNGRSREPEFGGMGGILVTRDLTVG